ncbi:hypothetical protein [Mesorhizobium sp. 113-3-3]|uniref:hypothetical protein n=1 Tax=Mesorhizobium sp. 113-3-3 TaxID=2744516 RepID=UPI0019253300|nr:hypothetical protein [Mesorhizobium sp. 113-3-3]
MMPDLSCRHPRVSGEALSLGTKRKRSGSLGLTEPFHRNFPQYSNLRGFFTPKKAVLQKSSPLSPEEAANEAGGNEKTAAIARGRFGKSLGA